MAAPQDHFRLLDLPGEIRNRIYKEVLCSFDYMPPTHPAQNMLLVQCMAVQEDTGISQATHSIETDLLRASKQIHREAYDVMVKTNQFIRVQAVDIPLATFLLSSRIPIVTMDREHAEQFKGYMMRVQLTMTDSMSAAMSEQGPRFDFVILGREWSAFCNMLDQADILSRHVRRTMDVTLTLDWHQSTLPDYKASIGSAFFRTTQQTVLDTLRKQLHSFENIRIEGSSSHKLAQEVLSDIKRSQWNDPDQILRELQQVRRLGQQYHAQGEYNEAVDTWMHGISSMGRMRYSSNWDEIAAEGGDPFFKELEDLLATMIYEKVQCAHENKHANPNSPSIKHNYTAILIMSPILGNNYFSSLLLRACLPTDADGPQLEIAMKNFLQARQWRMMGDPKMAEYALHLIHPAVEHTPDVAQFREERDNILEWAKTFLEFNW